MKKIIAVLLAASFITPAYPQSSKLTLDSEIDTNWPDNTSGLITPAILRSTVKDIVASYVDWLVCTTRGGIVYWNATATPTCLAAGVSGQFLQTRGPTGDPGWVTPALPAADLSIAANNTVVGNRNGTNQLAQELTATTVLDFIGTTVGTVLNRGAGVWAAVSQMVLGASGTLGSVTMGNATSGTVTIQPVAGALTIGDTMTIPSLTKRFAAIIAEGSTALNTAAIASTTCNTTTAAAPGAVVGDVIVPTFRGSTAAVTGYAPVTTGNLTVRPYITGGTANFEVCNGTLASITPGALTIDWKVPR